MHKSQLKEYKKTANRIQGLSILLVNVKEKLSQLVSRRIRELNLNNAEVARQTGLSRGYIGNIANETAPTQSGQYNLPPQTVKDLARVLQISEAEILGAMGYTPIITDDNPELTAIMHEIADSLMASGLDELDEEEAREAYWSDVRAIAVTMLKERIERQKRKANKS